MTTFDLATHLWLTITLVGVGAFFWLADDFLAERYEAGQDMRYGEFALPDPERETLGREEYKNRHAKSARYVGHGFLGLAGVSSIALLIRFIL